MSFFESIFNGMFVAFLLFVLVKALGASKKKKGRAKRFSPIPDQYKTFQQLQEGLRKAGLESSNLILGIDFTKSNEWTGKRSFGGRCLHSLSHQHLNPYQSVIQILGRTLEAFDDDKLIPAFGFGDATTGNRACFPFFPNRVSHGFDECLERYTQIVPEVSLSGPTNFGPIIREAINIVREDKSYHILVIIADGQVTDRQDTVNAIVEASRFPLSIVMVGVGDGPFDEMEEFDDELPARVCDNFQFVNFMEVMTKYDGNELVFATKAMMEIPDHFTLIKELGLMRNC
eukprot:TRINITY_DN6136_c0_g1_i1.p1 TRINITY_DN6136_c0_g1~~TRINITY_DN6136_c0_g1_i1.p1  ORF type:complete len:314 (-),score=103.40 TRINITY_DN6136_c0_g1_i1:36-896(-)